MQVVDPTVFFNSAVYYGIISQEDADKQQIMYLEKEIKKEFDGVSGVELKITFCVSNGMYKIRVPKGIREKYKLKKTQYTSKEKLGVLKVLYCDMFGAGEATTLSAACLEWIRERELDPDVSATTKRHDKEYYNKYIAPDPIGIRKIGSISVSDWDEFFKKLTQGRKMYRQSFTNVKSFLNLVNDFAVRRGYARHNNCREINPGAYKYMVSKKRSKIFTKTEIVDLYNYLREKDNIYDLCLALHLCFPCRIGEIKALLRSDVDLDNRKLYICKEVIMNDSYGQELADHTKSGLEEGNRVLYIPDAAIPVFKKIFAQTDSEELFLGKTGKWLLTQELNQHMKDACNALGIAYLSTHKTRAWFATEAAKIGMDEVTMTRTFGWKDRDTAKEYIRTARTETAQKEAIEQIIDF